MSEELKSAFSSLQENLFVDSSGDSEEKLKDGVRALLKEDVLALTTIRPLLKTSETLDHSLGNLYFYLKDRLTCRTSCPKKLSGCPKDMKGYCFVPVYDSDTDEIRLNKVACSYLSEFQTALSHIHPCYVYDEDILHSTTAITALMHDPDVLSKQKDTMNFLKKVIKAKKDFSKDDLNQGYALYCINSNSYAKSLLMESCFLFAKSGYRCAYVRMENLLSVCSDRNYSNQKVGLYDMELCKKAEVLCIENLNSLPFLSEDQAKEFLYGLFKERNQKGKITLACLSESVKPSSILRRSLYHSDCYDECKETVENLFETVTVSDFQIEK